MRYDTKYREAFSFFKVADLGELSLQTVWNFNLSTYTTLANASDHTFFFLPQKGPMPIKLICLSYGFFPSIISKNYATAQCCYQTEIESNVILPDNLAWHIVFPESISPQMLAECFIYIYIKKKQTN